MFTIDQIRAAHAKVKTGADFPSYIREISQLGVSAYETFVADGNTNYYGNEEDAVSSGAKYQSLFVADKSDAEQFQKYLKAHQQGKTNFLTFCNDCARSGVEKWEVDIQKMTCTYLDKAGNNLLTETIPG